MLRFRLSFSLIISAFVLTTPLLAQTLPKTGTATISGHVLLKNEPAAGVTVGLQPQIQSGIPDRSKNLYARTDQNGQFRITGINAGQYLLSALAPGFIGTSESQFALQGKPINIAEGENVENLEFRLKRGSVITGRITDSTGDPVVEIPIRLLKIDGNGKFVVINPVAASDHQRTDDRGVYRIYSLAPGKYKVSVGEPQQSQSLMVGTTSYYLQTFHPDTQDEDQAKIIDLGDEAEATDVDIKLTKAEESFTIAGRVVDNETNQPLSGINIGFGRGNPYSGFTSWFPGGFISDAQGEFEFRGLLPGKYSAFISSRNSGDDYYSDPVSFEASDGSADLIELKAIRGASISGKAVVEGTTDSIILSKLSQMNINASPESQESIPLNKNSKINADGSFRLTGLKPGKYRFGYYPRVPGLALVRIEQNGVPLIDGIEIVAGEKMSDVRVVFAYGNSTIRGQVKVVGGTIPPGLGFRVNARQVGTFSSPNTSGVVDARGQFIIKDMVAGEYELRLLPAYSSPPSPELLEFSRRIGRPTQRIMVGNAGEAMTEFIVDLSQKEKNQ